MRRALSKTYGAAEQLLLDEYPNAAAAYSLRDLASASVGSAVVRVRRSSDNAEQDFTATEITDGTLTTFTGANDGFVTTWYDQSGNNQDVLQTTATSQPKIVISGVLNLYNNKPSILVDGNQFLVADVSSKTNLAFAHNGSATTSYVSNFSNGIWFGTSSGAYGNDNLTGFEVGYGTQGAELAVRNNNVKRVADNIDNTEFYSGGVYFSSWNVLESDVNLRSSNYKNSSLLTQSHNGLAVSPVIVASSISNFAFFGKEFGTTNPTGNFSEMVIWEGIQADRINIETNINAYYNLY